MIILEGEFWYITNGVSENGDKKIRSQKAGQVFVPEQGWKYYDDNYLEDNDFSNCSTVRLTFYNNIYI